MQTHCCARCHGAGLVSDSYNVVYCLLCVYKPTGEPDDEISPDVLTEVYRQEHIHA